MIGSPPQVVVYTAIIGGYDPRTPSFAEVDPNIRYVCVVDQPDRVASAAPWEIAETRRLFDDGKLMSGFVKTHPELFVPDAGVAVWVDGNLEDIMLTESTCRDAVQSHPVAAIDHHQRTTVAAEAEEVCRLGLDSEPRVRSLLTALRDRGFRDDWGLAATMLVIRDQRVDAVGRMNAQWWQWIEHGSRRDQLSFTAALWSQGLAWERLNVEWWGPNALFSRNKAHREAPGRVIAPVDDIEPPTSP